METRIHTASNLYKYIENARQMENLDRQIKSKEADLKYYEQAVNMYESLGCESMAEETLKRLNKAYQDILVLKLKRVGLEKEMLEFELESFGEDDLKINSKNFSENNKNKIKTLYNIM